jgi:hypothetical protein
MGGAYYPALRITPFYKSFILRVWFFSQEGISSLLRWQKKKVKKEQEL